MKISTILLLASLAFKASVASAQVIAYDANSGGVNASFLDAKNGLIWTKGTAFARGGL